MDKQLKFKFARGPDGAIELELVLGAGGVKVPGTTGGRVQGVFTPNSQ